MTKATKSKKTGKTEGSKSQPGTVERIGVLVVHGVGEQRHYEHLEGIASNFVTALTRDRERTPHVQLLTRPGRENGGPAPDSGSTRAIVSWHRPEDGRRMQVHFREVFWADLDEGASLWRWMKLVGWALAMPGIRVFNKARSESCALPGMVPPKALSRGRWILVRALIPSSALPRARRTRSTSSATRLQLRREKFHSRETLYPHKSGSLATRVSSLLSPLLAARDAASGP